MPYKKLTGQEFGSSVGDGGALMLNSFLTSLSVLQGALKFQNIYPGLACPLRVHSLLPVSS